jgi:hypothetical protein
VGKVWVLDTETKGTGANMVPLERVLSKSGPMRCRGHRRALWAYRGRLSAGVS